MIFSSGGCVLHWSRPTRTAGRTIGEVKLATKSKDVAVPEATSQEIVIRPEVVAQFASMAMAIPDAEGSGSERILLAILQAESWDELDAPWSTEKAEAMYNIEQDVYEIMRRPSSYAGGLGMFLVVRAREAVNGRELVWTTGSISVVAQLVKAYLLGALPLRVILTRSDRPTENGYYPQHLQVIANLAPNRG